MLKQRVLYGFIGAVIAICVITMCPVYIIGICIGAICMIGLHEFYSVCGLAKNKSPLSIPGYIFGIVSTIATILLSSDVVGYMGPAVVVLVFVLMVGMVFFRQKTSFSDVSLVLTGTVYVVIFFMHVLLIRQMNYGKILIWILFISAWSTDTFAYFCGMGFGKHKLCPNISPKKTVEGSIGGIAGCIICICIYCLVISRINSMQFSWLNAFVVSLVASVFSQIGDLAASCIKRDNNAKDYGNLIPGHGGILDRFDSVLLIAPLMYYLMTYLPVFK